MRKPIAGYIMSDEERALVDDEVIRKTKKQMDDMRHFEINEGRLVKVTLEDLAGEANLAICENASKYDPERKTKNGKPATFSTYAHNIARSSFFESLRLFALIKTNKTERKSYKILNIESFEGDDSEVTDEYGTFAPPGNEIPVGEQDNYNIKYSTSDDHERKDIVDILLSKLSSLERQVVRMSYGFIDDAPTTDKEIAALLNRTPEKIKEIRERALKRMRRFLKIP